MRCRVIGTVAVAVLLGVAGCSGGDGGASGPASGTTPAPSGTAGSATATPTAGQSLAPLPVLASRKSSVGSKAVEIELNQARVEGQVLTVTFTARNRSSGTWQIWSAFDNHVKDGADDAAGVLGQTVDGVYVIDPTAAERYLVARDAQGRCVCSDGLLSTVVAQDQGVVLSAVFKAPPESVKTVDVHIPKAGTFTGVALER